MNQQDLKLPTIEGLGQIPSEQIPAMLAQLAVLQGTLAARLLGAPLTTNCRSHPPVEPDRLLDIREAAAMLSVSPDWLYRRTKKLPFVIRLGRQIRFSARDIEKHIRQRVG
jgi:predicted DNA-binding transcriptional regulator AlpA